MLLEIYPVFLIILLCFTYPIYGTHYSVNFEHHADYLLIPYHIVQVLDSPVASFYLTVNSRARPIPDIETVKTLQYNNITLEKISSSQLFARYDVLDQSPVPILHYSKNNPDADEATRIMIEKSKIFNGDLLRDIVYIGEYTNPSVFKFRNRLLLVTSRQVGLAGSLKKIPNNNMEFRWVNHSLYPYFSNEKFLGINTEIDPLNEPIIGQDPRVVVYNDSFFQIFFSFVLRGLTKQKMSLADVEYNKTSGMVEITYQKQRIIPTIDAHQQQKNWSPFIYQNETLLIQSINPLIVVRLENYRAKSGDDIQAVLVSLTFFEDPFREVDYRGGSNAILIGDRYLSFYHARTIIPHNFMISYIFGAYTFTRDPPFRVLSVSTVPITPVELFTGSWEGRFIDYCVYPMSVFLENDDVVMSFGYQDHIGKIAKIDLRSLLKSMTNIQIKK